jgi:exoribonuclease II
LSEADSVRLIAGLRIRLVNREAVAFINAKVVEEVREAVAVGI